MPPNTESIANEAGPDRVYETPKRLFYDNLGVAALAATERATAQRATCVVIKGEFYGREVYIVAPDISLVLEEHILFRAEPAPLDLVEI